MADRCWCDVDPEAFGHNLRQIRKLVLGRKIIAVVKADAYGHWVREAIKRMDEADMFAVATVNEALQVLDYGIKKPLLILYPVPDEEGATEAIAKGALLTIGSWESLEAAIASARNLGKIARVHMEIDTGMGRTGFLPDEVPEALEKVAAHPELLLEGVFTHFSKGADEEMTQAQLERFLSATRGLPPGVLRHAASSPALMRFPETHLDGVRPGIAIYGCPPDRSYTKALALMPALSLRSRVIQVKEMPPGHGVSYRALYVPGKPKRIAVVGVGYEDGYPPVLANIGQVIIRGKRRRVRGVVCMDSIMVDASEEPLPQVGDVATIIGRDGDEEITALDLAEQAGTIPYDILTGIGRRVKRIYRPGGL
ncbi:MAG: alanine racemase [candidate division WOR-3 bacterium]